MEPQEGQSPQPSASERVFGREEKVIGRREAAPGSASDAAEAPEPAPPVAPTTAPNPEPATMQPPASTDQPVGQGGALQYKAPPGGFEDTVKAGTPKGIYVLAALTILVALITLFASSNTVAVGASVVDLLLGVGLLFRKEIARKIIVILSVIIVVLYALALVGIYLNQQTVDSKADQTIQAFEQASASEGGAQQSAVNAEVKKIRDQETTLNNQTSRAYASVGFEILVSIALIVYLRRDSVKDAFS